MDFRQYHLKKAHDKLLCCTHTSRLPSTSLSINNNNYYYILILSMRNYY